MAKLILEFSLPEEKHEFDLAFKGSAYSCVLDEIINHLRNQSKYEDKEVINIQDLRNKIADWMNEYDLDS